MFGIKKVTFTEDFRCFSKSAVIEFGPGVNIIVGDQGTGKSSLYTCIQEAATSKTAADKEHSVLKVKGDPIGVFAFDFEKDNHRTSSYFSPQLPMDFQAEMRFISHGEYAKTMFYQVKTAKKALLLMDEPDTALSPRSCLHLAKMFQRLVDKQDCQVIVMCHNPILFMSQEEVYNLEEMAWINAADYLQKQLTENITDDWF